MTIKAWPDLQTGTGEIVKNLNIFWGKVGKLFGGHSFSFVSLSHSKLQNVNMILFGAIPDATNAFPMSPLFITAVKDICTINTFEKLLNISFSEGYC